MRFGHPLLPEEARDAVPVGASSAARRNISSTEMRPRPADVHHHTPIPVPVACAHRERIAEDTPRCCAEKRPAPSRGTGTVLPFAHRAQASQEDMSVFAISTMLSTPRVHSDCSASAVASGTTGLSAVARTWFWSLDPWSSLCDPLIWGPRDIVAEARLQARSTGSACCRVHPHLIPY